MNVTVVTDGNIAADYDRKFIRYMNYRIILDIGIVACSGFILLLTASRKIWPGVTSSALFRND